MNKLMYVLALFAVLAGAAQAVAPPEDNGIGVLCVFTTPDPPFENQATVAAVQTLDLYFVLYHPIAPSGFIGAADFGWALDPAVPFFVLSSGGPGNTINIGVSRRSRSSVLAPTRRCSTGTLFCSTPCCCFKPTPA